MRIGSLFSGIGGLELGLEWGIPGAHTVWQVEQDPYARAVLAKHWPRAHRYEDIRHVGREQLAPVDLVCGGFPCQDISLAGKGAGLAGERSGLWFEYARVIEELRPRWVVAENVSALRARGLDVVLGSLAALGYDAEWHCIPAAAVGAPHRRDRLFLLAYPGGLGWRGREGDSDGGLTHGGAAGRAQGADGPLASGKGGRARVVADAHGERFAERPEPDGQPDPRREAPFGDDTLRLRHAVADPAARRGRVSTRVQADPRSPEREGWWAVEPDVGRVAHGVRSRVDRLRCLGNAVVPQVAEVIGRMIAEREAQSLPLAA